MIKITQYQAFDGTLFNDEDECIEYETKSKNITDNVYLQVWDHETKVMKSIIPTQAWYVKCNKEGMDYFNCFCKIYKIYNACRIIDKDNLYNSSDVLCWCWDDIQNKWVNFDTQVQHVKDCCKLFGIPFDGKEEGKEQRQ